MLSVADERYKAPEAAVGGQEAAQDALPRPYQVTRALQLLWTVFAISLVTLHPAVRGDWWLGSEGVEPALEDAALVGGLIIAGLFGGFYMGLVVLIGRRHAWARWVMLGFLVLGWLIQGVDLPRSLSETPAAAVADLVMAAAEVWAIWLLYSPPASAWFRRR
jgi:hypothetical protein